MSRRGSRDNSQGQLGDGTTVARTSFASATIPTTAHDITAGAMHTCVVDIVGDVYCWGANDWGQLGDGSMTRRLSAVSVAGLR